MMSKHDYELIAQELRMLRWHNRHWVIRRIADYCAATNPKFDRELFYKEAQFRERYSHEE